MGVVSREAVKEFIYRDLDDWRWLKKLRREDLMEEIRYLAPKLRFKTTPFTHQLACMIIGIYNPYFLFFLDMGAGKSKIVLDLIDYYRKSIGVKKTLILVPSPTTIYSFLQQIEEHSNLSYTPLYGAINERWNLLEKSNTDIYILNYTGMMLMTTDADDGRWSPNIDRVREFSQQFDSVVFDEIHLCKNHNTLTFKLCQMISRNYKLRYGLTGTPMGRDPQDLWSQFKLIDDGDTLGRNLGMFRAAFFHTKPNYWGGWEFKFNNKLEREFNATISNKSIRYEEDELNDLPPVIRRTVEYVMPSENRHYYDQAVKGLISVKGNYKEIDNIFVRLRQICSGFVKHKLDELEDNVLIDFDFNPKLEILGDLIDGISISSKIVIFHEFIHSGELIAELLKRKKITFERLYGATKDKPKVVDTFIKKSNIRVLVANTQSGGIGLNLQVANYVIYYESPVSPIVRRQSEKRVARTGQTKRVFIYDIIMTKSVETKILDYITQGKNLFEALIEGKIKSKELNALIDKQEKASRSK